MSLNAVADWLKQVYGWAINNRAPSGNNPLIREIHSKVGYDNFLELANLCGLHEREDVEALVQNILSNRASFRCKDHWISIHFPKHLTNAQIYGLAGLYIWHVNSDTDTDTDTSII